MGKIKEISQLTQNPHLNMYYLNAEDKNGGPVNYYVASRAKSVERLKLQTGKNNPDGVLIYSICEDKVVLVRQYRYTLNDYIYEFPAGLVEEGEDYHDAAVREMKEETGLTLCPLKVDQCYEKPYFTTIGMTDESCATVYGYAQGKVTTRYLEEAEELQVVLADRAEVRRILQEENVAIMCAYMLMHYLNTEDPFVFLN